MNILFIDAKCSENYDFKYMESHPLGGTESTVLRLVKELAKDHKVYLSQINRTERYIENGVTFIHHNVSLSQKEFTPDIIIIIRKYKFLKTYSLIYPQAKLFVWVHNFSKYEILGRRHWMAKTNAKIICVSQTHENHINKILNGTVSWIFRLITFNFKKIYVTYIYNTIEHDFSAKTRKVNPNKLLFFSAPYKGLKETMIHFGELLKKSPNYKLYITADEISQDAYNLDKELIDSNSVVFLGRISKNEIIDHLRESFCVFYPQHVFAETFGLVYVEANCAGTPVLTHDIGSAKEVLKNKEQIVDARNSKEVVKKILEWKEKGRPKVTCDDRFFITHTIKKWKNVLEIE